MPLTVDDSVVRQLASAPKKPGRKFKAEGIKADEATFLKVLLIGRSGIGKTRAFIGPLLAGQRVFVADHDFGGNGLATVREHMKAIGRPELLENIHYHTFKDQPGLNAFEAFNYWMDYPESMDVDGQTLWEWDPDVLAWDGFSYFQSRDVFDRAMSIDPIAAADKVSDARSKGVWAERTDWGVIKGETLSPLDTFLRIHNPNGKKVHKIVTVLQGADREDRLTGETRKGPLIQGSARDYMVAGFDLILTLDAIQKPGTKQLEYFFRCDVSDRSIVSKTRGLKIEPKEPADFEALWRRLCGLGGTNAV